MSRDNAKLPASSTSSHQEIDKFLRRVAEMPPRPAGGRGRLAFAMDATASREATWDQASFIQADMFREAAALGGLDIQLIYYRGFAECAATPWLHDPDRMLGLMQKVSCLGGRTQIERVLRHVIKETRKTKVHALVFVGDCMEEDIDSLCHAAGELGLLGVPAFMFHEGNDVLAAQAFSQVARLTGGAHCRFDANSPKQLRDLLRAVAVFAAGGRQALLDYGKRQGGTVLQLTHQMERR